MRVTRRTLGACLWLAVAGCDRGMSGKYVSERGPCTVEFKPDDKAILTVPIQGTLAERTCEVHGDKVILRSPGEVTGGLVLTRNADGTLFCDSLGGKLTKQ